MRCKIRPSFEKYNGRKREEEGREGVMTQGVKTRVVIASGAKKNGARKKSDRGDSRRGEEDRGRRKWSMNPVLPRQTSHTLRYLTDLRFRFTERARRRFFSRKCKSLLPLRFLSPLARFARRGTEKKEETKRERRFFSLSRSAGNKEHVGL